MGGALKGGLIDQACADQDNKTGPTTPRAPAPPERGEQGRPAPQGGSVPNPLPTHLTTPRLTRRGSEPPQGEGCSMESF